MRVTKCKLPWHAGGIARRRILFFCLFGWPVFGSFPPKLCYQTPNLTLLPKTEKLVPFFGPPLPPAPEKMDFVFPPGVSSTPGKCVGNALAQGQPKREAATSPGSFGGNCEPFSPNGRLGKRPMVYIPGHFRGGQHNPRRGWTGFLVTFESWGCL